MFRLIRYFSITSLIAFIIVTVILGVLFRQAAVDDLVELGEINNVVLTQTFANSFWEEYSPFLTSAAQYDIDELRERPETINLQQDVLELMENLTVIKVKVYDIDGFTVFSTEFAQIGDDKSENAGFIAAKSGDVVSELTHRDTFSAFEDVIEDRDVISSYVPLWDEDGNVAGVFEVYNDVTPLLHRIEGTQRNVIISIVVTLTILYAILYFIVRHADGVIRRQRVEREQAYAERLQAEQALKKTDDELVKQNQLLERANFFFLSTLEQMTETVQRGAPSDELMTYIQDARTQFDRLN
jgi:hypothetical protein